MKVLKPCLAVLLVLLMGAGTVGLALIPAASQAATTWGVKQYAGSIGWISHDETVRVAQEVWGFAVRNDPPTLPAEINGKQAFPVDQVEHLRDVQSILNAAWTTLVLAIVAVSALSVLYVRLYGKRAFGKTLVGAGAAILTLILVLGAAAYIDFERFFELFHELLFPAGTWVFDANSLLIQTFPEPFWAFLGTVWLTGVIVLSTVLLGFGTVLNRNNRQTS